MTPQEQIDEMSRTIETLRRSVPTPEEYAFIRNKMRDDANVAWLVQQVRRHAPWILILASAVGSAIYYFATHTINISGPR